MDEVTRTGQYAVVLASRPYQTDTLVNHDLPAMLTGFGVPVLTVDSLPGLDDVPLDASALDIVNNYHARMLESAVITARNPHLEYIQIVSFGCGHDAYLSDEITRLLREIAGRTPLILKLDESDVQGPLRIRVRSFLETLNMRRAAGLSAEIHPLPDSYRSSSPHRTAKPAWCWFPTLRTLFAGYCPPHLPPRACAPSRSNSGVKRRSAWKTVCAQRYLLSGADGHWRGAGRASERPV